MATIVYPHTFVPNTPARASEVNANFDAVTDQVNGNINADNLANNAVTTSKIENGAVTNVKLGANSVTDAKVASGIDASKIANGSVSNIEFQRLDGVSSSIQGQLDNLAANLTSSFSRFQFGRVSSAGTPISMPSGWTVSRLSTGVYEIIPNINTVERRVFVSPETTSVLASVLVSGSAITVSCVNTSNVATNTSFVFMSYL